MTNLIVVIVFVSATGLMILAVELVRQLRRQRERLNKLLHKDAPTTDRPARDPISEFFLGTLPQLASRIVPQEQEQAKQKHQRAQFVQAGIYRPEAMAVYHGARLVCLLIPAVGFAIGSLAHVWDLQPTWLLVTILLMVCGWNAPSVWLSR